MTKTISTTVGILIVVLVSGVAGVSILFFSQREVALLENEITLKETKLDEDDMREKIADIDKDRLKEEIKATEIISYDLADSGRIRSVEFWTEAKCYGEYRYKVPEGFVFKKFGSCTPGEIGSHGGCPTCEMSKISLTMAVNSLEDYVESINIKELSLGEKIKKRQMSEIEDVFYDKFSVDTNFKKNFISPDWEETDYSPSETSLKNNYNSTLDVLDYFFKEIDIKNLVNGGYSKKDIQNIFEDQNGQTASGYSHDEDIFEFRNFEMVIGNFDHSHEGRVAMISFTRSERWHNHPSNHYILIVNSEGEKRLLLEMVGHKTRGWININPLNIGGSYFFEARRSGYGGTCVGLTTAGTICGLKNMNFFCYEKSLYESYHSMGPGCGSQENILKEYEVKDTNEDGKNELVINFTVVYVVDISEDEIEEQTKKIMEETYKLDRGGDLVLIDQNIF
jgi:hypothetical protein